MATLSPEIPADWRAAAQLLQAGHYQQAADVLQTLQSGASADNLLLTLLLGSVQQICLTCLQYHDDVERYQHASALAAQREHQLRQHGQTILHQLTGQTSPEAARQLTQAIPAPPPGGLRQRLQNLLGRSKPAVFTEQTLPLMPALAPEPDTPAPLPAAEHVEPPPPAAEPATDGPRLPPSPPLFSQPHTPADEPVTITVEDRAYPEAATSEAPAEPRPPLLTVYCLGAFQVYLDDQPIGEWVSGKGQLIFKYLVTHRERPVPKEVLMDLFWPEANAEAARNNLNVAISGLRRALRQHHAGFSHVVFHNDAYLLNPELDVWVDVEEFSQHYRAGQRYELAGEVALAMQEYQLAEAFWQGEYLADDRYEDWPRAQRQRLQEEYLDLLDRLSRYHLEQQHYESCLVLCNKMLGLDSCHEEAHRRLMRCYAQQGHHHLALRQYHLCVAALKRELDVPPDQPTQALYAQIRRRRPV